MFDALDETLKKLLIQEIPVKKNEIDIVFDQPNSEWSARVSKPTLNVYLYEISENRSLRGSEQLVKRPLPDGNVEIRRNPVRVDLYYLVTAWSKNEQDQHHLLGLTLIALLRNPFLPPEVFVEGMAPQSILAPLSVVQADDSKNWGEFWNTLGNKYHPGLTLKVTLTIDPYRPVIAPQVNTTEVNIQQSDTARTTKSEAGRYWMVGGEIKSGKYDPSALTLTWEEKNLTLEIDQGRFAIRKIPQGDFHLCVRLGDRILKRLKFTVPLNEPLKIEV